MSSAADAAARLVGRPDELGSPAEAPCRSCPYRRDVPSGIWHISEYEKLPRYDRDTGAQPTAVFQCHLTDQTGRPSIRPPRGRASTGLARICAGWAGCHDGDNLLSLRMGVMSGLISPETAYLTVTYSSPVPLWESGAAAAVHGLTSILDPSDEARRVIDKLVRVYGKDSRQEPAGNLAVSAAGGSPSDVRAVSASPAATAVTRRRAARFIHVFLVESAGFDAGEPMVEQAAELTDRLADAGLLDRRTSTPPARDATTVIRDYIVECSGEDLDPLTTGHAEQLRDILASAGLLEDGVLQPVPLTRPAE
ncbi:DUF6283 family protein [Amycolatopsis azurea]|uniref:DUF6283 family protein n=1 Tax=Amycolatopsis azurea TaxID=36819 RepID=UPI00382337D4